MQKSGRIPGIIGTILVHLLVILFFITTFSVPTSPPANIVETEKPKPIEVTLLAPPTISPAEIRDDGTEKITYPVDSLICATKDKTYFGVGIIVSFGSDRITHAPEYYPAYKAGMRVGDFVVNSDSPIVNGWVDYDVVRDNAKQYHFHIKVDAICFEKG